MENSLVVFRELNMEYDSAIPFLEIHPKRVKAGTETDPYIPMSTAAASKAAKKGEATQGPING